MALLCGLYLSKEMVLCCFMLTGCPASCLFWAEDQGDGLPCCFKEMELSHYWGQPEHQDMVAVCIVLNATQQPGRRKIPEWQGGKSCKYSGVHLESVWMSGENKSYSIFLICKPATSFSAYLRSQTVPEASQVLLRSRLVSSSVAPKFGEKNLAIYEY